MNITNEGKKGIVYLQVVYSVELHRVTHASSLLGRHNLNLINKGYQTTPDEQHSIK